MKELQEWTAALARTWQGLLAATVVFLLPGILSGYIPVPASFGILRLIFQLATAYWGLFLPFAAWALVAGASPLDAIRESIGRYNTVARYGVVFLGVLLLLVVPIMVIFGGIIARTMSGEGSALNSIRIASVLALLVGVLIRFKLLLSPSILMSSTETAVQAARCSVKKTSVHSKKVLLPFVFLNGIPAIAAALPAFISFGGATNPVWPVIVTSLSNAAVSLFGAVIWKQLTDDGELCGENSPEEAKNN